MNNEYKQLAVIAIVFAGILLYAFRFMPNEFNHSSNFNTASGGKSPEAAKKIPDEVFDNSQKGDGLFDVLTSDKKVIYWAYANCPIGKTLKSSIDAGLSTNNLAAEFKHYPDLQSGGVAVFCKNRTVKCVQNYLFSNCSDSVCIINPTKREILFIRGHDASTVVQKAIDIKNW